MEYFRTFEDAYIETLSDIKAFGIKSSPRGRGTKELIGHGFTITNPRDRIIALGERKVNPFYMVGNLLWVLSQSNKLDFINYYNPRGINFSDDGEILRGAYGKRIFDMDGVNQIHQCIKELKVDPDSRRAVVHIHMAQHDWHGSLDTPCTIGFQFFIREGKLIMVNYMRSQSGAFVMPYDIFLMTMLHEIVANELGVEVGEYKHICSSIHYYDNEEKIVDKLITDYEDETPSYLMPKFNAKISDFKQLLVFEKELRASALSDKDTAFHKYYEKLLELKLEHVLYQIGVLLIICAAIVEDKMIIADKLTRDFLDKYFAQLIKL